MNSGEVIIEAKLNTKSFDAQIDKLTDKLDTLEQEYEAALKDKQFPKDELIKYREEIEKTSNKLSDLYRKQNELNQNHAFEKLGSSINGIIKKVTKWGLAIFGVRSAYLGIRQAMSILSQYDDQMATNIEYIKYALAMVLKPIIEWIVNAVMTLLQYVNYIANAWFGINLFANASAKSFQKANKNAKQLQKTLAGFDEMNVLNKDGSVGSLGSGVPSIDLSNIKNVEIPDWVKWIADNKDIILTVLGSLAATFAASKVLGWVSNLGVLGKALGTGSGILGLLTSIATFGAIAITIGIVGNVLKETQELKDNIDKINKNNRKYQQDWLKKEEDINTIIQTQNVNRAAANRLLEQNNGWVEKILGLDKKNLQTARNTAENIGDQITREVELYKKKVKTEGVTEETKELNEQIKNSIIEQYNWNLNLIEKLKEAGMDTGEIEKVNRDLIQNYKDMNGQVVEIKDGLGNINALQFDDKVIKVDMKVNTSGIAKQVENEFKGKKIRMTTYADGEVKIDYYRKGGIFYPGAIPRLAVGGVINNPGKGVPLGIGGESGAEGVIPLTDSQQMELLGEAIGKYITVNLTNVTELDGRTIARKVQEVNNGTNFLLNR
jgi:hypothetical protein